MKTQDEVCLMRPSCRWICGAQSAVGHRAAETEKSDFLHIAVCAAIDVRLDTSLELLLERAPPEPIARVLATVVATAGSTYRKPGARMLIMADGSYLGLLSGGCLEADLKLHAQQVIESGAARAIEYDMRGPDDILFGIGAGCEGAMRVLLEPADAGSPAAAALAAAGQATAARACRTFSLRSTNRRSCLSAPTAAASLPPVLAAAAEQSLAESLLARDRPRSRR